MRGQPLACEGAYLLRIRRQARHPCDHVLDQVESVEVVEYRHVEWRRGRAFLLVAADMQVAVVGAPVSQLVDQGRIAMEGENDRLVPGEERVERFVGKAV